MFVCMVFLCSCIFSCFAQISFFFCLFWSLSLTLKIFLKCLEVHDCASLKSGAGPGSEAQCRRRRVLLVVLSVGRTGWDQHMITDSEPHSEISVGLFWAVSFSKSNTQRLFLFRVLRLFIVVPGFRAEKGAERLWSDMLPSQLCPRLCRVSSHRACFLPFCRD